MLDLVKLSKQMQGMGQQLTQESRAARQRLVAAQELLAQVQPDQAYWVAQLQQWRDRLEFVAAEPIEPLDTREPIGPAPIAHSLIATDGSQIAPSHHEIAYCYLINTGRVVLHYGQKRYPLLDSVPEIFYKPEDLYLSRQWGISTEDWMGHRRTVAEAIALADLGTDLHHNSVTGNSKNAPPTLAMVDGSLIYWFLDRMPSAAVDRILPP
ncbi:MAG TPA: DNA double-strand break repair nuclease NurA, partial [Coleofasciculaceae cyanobacterium]